MPKKNKELQKAGLKATLPRIKILEVLDSKGHLSAEDIYKELILLDEDVGLATIYRVLTQFESAGIVIKHNFEEGHAVYEIVSDEHHDHMVDVDSGKVVEFFDELIENRQKEIAERVIKKVNLKLSGNVVTKSSLLKNYCPAEEYHQRYLEKR